MRVTPPVVGALAVLLVLLGATQHAEAQGDWYTGRATFFGGDAWSIHKGSCLYGYLDGYTKTGWDVAALANANADFSGSCGRCYEVACQPLEFYDNYGEYLDRRGACRDPSASVVVQVVDACQCYEPSNPYSNQRWCCGDMYHMDLSIWAFSKLVWSPESSGSRPVVVHTQGRCYEVACQPLEFYDNFGEYLNRRGACRDPGAATSAGAVTATVRAFSDAKERQWSEDDPGGNIIAVVAENKLSAGLVHERLSRCSPPPLDALCYPSSYSGTLELRRAMAGVLEATFMKGVRVRAEDLIVQSGAGAILDNLFWVIGEPGQGILIPAPYYPQFDKDLTVKCEMVPVPFKLEEGGGEGSVARQLSSAADAAEARGSPAVALLLTNPNNPLGTLYSKGTLIEALAWCMQRGVHVVSDEIYALSVWGDATAAATADPFVSLEVLAREAAASGQLPYGDANVAAHLHVVWGLSKDFSVSGLRVGCLHTRSVEVWQAVDSLSYYTSCSGHTQHLLTQLLSDTQWLHGYLEVDAKRLRHAHGVLAGELDAAGIPFLRGQAALFCWLDLRQGLRGGHGEAACSSSIPQQGQQQQQQQEQEQQQEQQGGEPAPGRRGGAGSETAGWEDEEVLWRALAYDHGVFLTPGFYCHAPEPGFFRMCFSWVQVEALPVAVARMRAALDRVGGNQ
ncbi:hypothetical protein FOA52_010539 [Chlamydomonas sp. UWO 241]|nr:hypothetical protein FOA52_010539 [Chlamydomonas sp. UWO 241]